MAYDYDWKKLLEQARAQGLGGQTYNEAGAGTYISPQVNAPDGEGIVFVPDGYGGYTATMRDPQGSNGASRATFGFDAQGNQVGDAHRYDKNSQLQSFGQAMKGPAMVAAAALTGGALSGALGGVGAGAGLGMEAGLGGAAGEILGAGGMAGYTPGMGLAGAGASASGGSLLSGLGDSVSGLFSGGGPELLGEAGGYGLKTAGGGMLEGLGGVGNAVKLGGALLGGLAGSKETPGGTTTNTRTLDPRIDSRVFGQGGLMDSADKWFNENKATGQNQTMVDAQDWTRGVLQMPEVRQGLSAMGSRGIGLMQQPVAGNPFAGWTPPQPPQQQPPGMSQPYIPPGGFDFEQGPSVMGGDADYWRRRGINFGG